MSRYDYSPAPEGRDPYLWHKAQIRASFKAHALSYVLVNCLLVGVWFFTRQYSEHIPFWPIWPILGWGIGLASHAYRAYSTDKGGLVEREYRKLSDK